jgi:hypothetical protein
VRSQPKTRKECWSPRVHKNALHYESRDEVRDCIPVTHATVGAEQGLSSGRLDKIMKIDQIEQIGQQGSRYRLNVAVRVCQCELCGKAEEACLYHGDMRVDPEIVNGRLVFRLRSEPLLRTYWLFDPKLYKRFTQCVEAETQLATKITDTAGRSVRVTVVGPCTDPESKGGYVFYFANELTWPAVGTFGGIIQLLDEDELRKAIKLNAQAPEPAKTEVMPTDVF